MGVSKLDPFRTIRIAYLLTESSIKIFVLPVVVFNIFCAIQPDVFLAVSAGWDLISTALLRMALYAWLLLFFFDPYNQKDPGSVEEDRLNKPWRPIPSGQLSVQEAKTWSIAATWLLLATSGLWLGGLLEALAFIIETWIYFDAGASDSWWGKNLLGAAFYCTGYVGGLRVLAHSMEGAAVTSAAYDWCLLNALVIFLTIQIQDFRDIEGDKSKGRLTMPIALGDLPTRWYTSLCIAFLSLLLPAYWAGSENVAGYLLPLGTGSLIIARLFLYQHKKGDRFTFHLYASLWLPSLFIVPLTSNFGLSALV